MRITLGNIDGKTYGLNASEACVYAAIEKCSRGDNAKGWYGTMEALAGALPFKVSHKTCGRAIAKLLNLGIVTDDAGKLYAKGQNVHDDGQNVQENGQIVQENGQIVLPPNNPPINNKNMKEEIEQSRADMRTRDGANQQQQSSNLIDQFNAMRRKWIRAGGVTAEFERRSSSIWGEWKEMSEPKRQVILNNLSQALMTKRQPMFWKDNPLFFLRDYPEPEPTNYNGARSFPDEPLVIATYREIGGIYTEREAKLFGMNIIKPFKP